MKPRHHLYLDDALTAELERLAKVPGASKSAIIADALQAYLTRGAAHEVDAVLKTRLAYIVTGDNAVDEASKLGLAAVSAALKARTTASAACFGSVSAVTAEP